jgi:hypothetical protein
MPTSAFPKAPQYLAILLLRRWNAPLPLLEVHSFGDTLDARLLSTPPRSTSELLRTL